MSEYQYYEFQTIDRPLTSAQQTAMRGLSKRVDVSATRAIFNYSYGNFPDEPMEVLGKDFDALLYIANWGSKQLAFRFPKNTIAEQQLQPYLLGEEETYTGDLLTTDQHYILTLELREEGGYGWIEGAGLLDPLIPLREAILRGDRRALYLFWLRTAEERVKYEDYQDEQLVEPPVPPGLGKLDPALRALVEFFEIDEDLIAAAAEASPALTETKEPLEQWVTLLPDSERTAFLLRVARGEGHVGVELVQRLRELGGAVASPAVGQPARSFAELQARAKHQEQLRVQREQAKAEKARLAKLADLAQREEQLWASLPGLLARRTGTAYEEAVALLVDLRSLAIHRNERSAFDARRAELTAPYAGSQALQRRLKDQQLV